MRTRHGYLTTILLAATVSTSAVLYFSLRAKPKDPATDPPLDPAAIAFPAVSGAAKAKLLAAQEAHREALRLYLAPDRVAGDGKAREALRLYEEAGAVVPEISGLHYEILVSLAEDDRVEEAMAETSRWIERFPADRLHRAIGLADSIQMAETTYWSFTASHAAFRSLVFYRTTLQRT